MKPQFDNSEQTPYPLDTARRVDIRPYDHGIPLQEQDLDTGRVDPRDGQDVVDELDRRGPSPDDIGTSASDLPEGVFYGDLRPRSRDMRAAAQLGASGFNALASELFNDE